MLYGPVVFTGQHVRFFAIPRASYGLVRLVSQESPDQ